MARITGAENSIINRVVKNNDPAELLARMAESNRSLEAESARQAERDRVLQQRNANKAAPTASPAPAVQPAAPTVGMTEEQRLNELENAHRQAQRNYEELQRYAGYATTVEQADEYRARQKAAEEELLKARDALRSNELRQSQLEALKAEQEKARRELEAAQTSAAWDVTGGESARQVDAARSRLNEISEQIKAKELPAWEEKLAGSSLLQGLDQAGYKLAQTVDFLAGGLIDEGFNILRQTGASLGMDIDWSKPNAWERYLQSGAAGIQNTAQNIDEAAGENEAAQAVGKYAPMVVEAVPQAVLALMTAGTSSAAQGTTAAVQGAANMAQAGRAAQAVMPVINATAVMAKDPAWLYSFANSAGASYADALADGATEEEAALYSLLSSSVSAMMETGGSSQMGGIDKLPKQIQEALARGERSPVLQWLKSIGSESAEEVLQGISSNAARGVYDPNLEWGSMTDENAVFNPNRMLEEAKGGAIVSAILGGGQTAASVASNAISSAATSQNPEQNAAEEAEASPQQETAPTTPQSSTEASEALNTQESGDAVGRVLQMLQPGMSNNQARAIMDSPELLAAFNSLRGEELSGSHAEQRAAIKNYANALASGQAQSEAQAAPQSQTTDTAQMLADMAAGRDTQQNAPSQQNIDSTVNSAYNENINNQTAGGINGTGSGTETDRTGVPGVYAGRASDVGSGGKSGGPSVNSGLVLLSEEAQKDLQERGVYVPMKSGSEHNAAFSAALNSARESDSANGWAVSPQSAEEISRNGGTVYLSEDGSSGFIVSADGDIQGVFKNKAAGAPKGASQTLIPMAIANGGVKLDCYGENLVRLYSKYGFVPVARVKFDPSQANDGWTPDKGYPDIYFMVYRGNGAESAVKQYGQFPAITEEQFASLPEMEYEEAANYRDTLLLAPQTAPVATINTQPAAPAVSAVQSAETQGEMTERGFTRNVESSAYTEETLRADLEANREVYRELSNKETLAKATAIYESGFVNAHNTLLGALHNAKNGAKLAPEMVPLSRMVANELARQGRIEEAHAIVSDVAAELTAAGQLGQAGAILKNEGPAAKAAAIKKMVEKLNNVLTKRQKNANVKRGKGTKAGRITVDENLITAYANAQSETERNAVLDLITTQIAEQIPPTFMDRWNAWRYTAMLGNLKTQGRNIIGNLVFGVEASAKRRVQALMELVAAKASGGKYQPTVSAFASRQLIKDARADFDNVADTIGGEAKYSESALIGKAIQDKRKLLPGFLEDYRRGTSLLMEWGDRIFLRFHYVDALSTYLQAHGVKSINEASPEMLEAAREFAVKEAQEATFRDRNAVSDFVTQLGKARPGPDGKINPVAKGFEIASQGIAPFRRTPANVLVRGEEYSPLGVANTIVNAVRAKSGSTDAAAAINSAAKTVTGTGLFLAGWALAMAGLARGTEDDEELAEFQAMQGQQDWSVTVGDKQVSFAQFAPAALPFAIGIKMAELHQDGEGFSLDTAMELLGAVSDPMLEMSMLQGINDAFENITSYGSDTKALPALMVNSLVSYLTQGLSPSVLRQTEQAYEENRQTIYRDNSRTIDALIGDQQYAVGKLAAGIPGVDYHQQDYIDAWGRTQSNGNWLERNFNAIYNPTYIGEDRSTEVDAELERLYEATNGIDGVGNVLPQRPARSTEVDGERLSPEEFVEYSKAKGQKSLELVQAFMEGELYKGLNDEQRAASIKSLYGYAAETAKNAIRAARGAETEPDKYKRLKAEEIPEYIALVQSTNAAVSDRDYSGIDAMLEAAGGMSLNAQVMFEDSTGVGKLLEAAEAGVGSEAYYAAKDAVDEAAARLGRADANASNKLTGLATADINERERDALAEILLGKTAYGYYQRAIASGMTPRDTANLYMSIDSDWDGTVERAEAYEYLTGKGISGQQAEDIWDLFGWNSDFAKYKPK